MGVKVNDPGVGSSSVRSAKRMIDQHGHFNVKHHNKPKQFSEAYHYLLSISWVYFFSISLISYLVANLVFALLYVCIGVEQLTVASTSISQDFINAFFFSTQTFTTVGYGAIAPKGVCASILASFEAFAGLMFFAFTTGLLYGRFSKPRAAIRFSKHLILRDFKEGKALMFRIVNDRQSTMINPEAVVTLVHTQEDEAGVFSNSFYTLKLDRNKINFLPTSWTLVHQIDEESPLYGLTEEELLNQQAELMVMVSYYDESFNQVVHQLYSYLLKSAMVNYKFVPTYYYNQDGDMVLDHDLFDKIEPLKS